MVTTLKVSFEVQFYAKMLENLKLMWSHHLAKKLLFTRSDRALQETLPKCVMPMVQVHENKELTTCPENPLGGECSKKEKEGQVQKSK